MPSSLFLLYPLALWPIGYLLFSISSQLALIPSSCHAHIPSCIILLLNSSCTPEFYYYCTLVLFCNIFVLLKYSSTCFLYSCTHVFVLLQYSSTCFCLDFVYFCIIVLLVYSRTVALLCSCNLVSLYSCDFVVWYFWI